LYASACYRFGQIPLEDTDPWKLDMYRALIETFGRAGQLFDPPFRHVQIPYRHGRLCGWMITPPGVGRAPVVIVWGGFDGWREEYFSGAMYLRQRGIGTFLLDGPGQGETRLFHRLYFEVGAEAHFATAAIDYLLAEGPTTGRIGVWGNSMGGSLAALAAASDPRIAACCVNGGSLRPIEIVDRYPRFVRKLQLLLGIDDDQSAIEAFRRLDLSDRLGPLRCPLLVVHGAPDRVFLLENARRLLEEAAFSTDRQLVVFDDGDHCVYNRSHEKHCLIGDWFLDCLSW
jgi:dipeptidyl aminopeptidase/acylaminoacyl peptidase